MSVTASMWTNSVFSLAFFTIFGLTADARATYHGAFFTVVRLLKRTKTTEAPASDADSDVTELEKEVKNDTTVTVSFIDICASAPDAAMPTALKDGLEAEPKRVSRISAAEMDAARLSRSGDGVAVCGDRGVTLGNAVVVVVV
ncbi:hypothetical protein OF83DRAFT_1084847 [Amylostereum chailletii]|nr:hypothetical protein OF83DRAFT_1084847 [Amylostereum chailletii]